MFDNDNKIPDNVKEFVGLVDLAERYYNSDASWEMKYSVIFSNSISKKIRKIAIEIGIDMNYYDPDTTYKEDVTSYMNYVMEKRDKLIDMHA